MTTLIIATRNAHKVDEIRAILGDGFRCRSLGEFSGAPAGVEDGETFEDNAAKKALTPARWLAEHVATDQKIKAFFAGPVFVLADDSGLEVDALGGAPGVHSARFAALDDALAPAHANSSDQANNAKLLRLLQNVAGGNRAARFKCVMALVPVDSLGTVGTPRFFQGTCEGKIAIEPSGRGGFGYDPLFVPDGFRESFAELGEEIKNRLSHRARALEKLASALD